MALTITTPEIWSVEAKKIMTAKGIDTTELSKLFSSIQYPWNDQYNSDRVYYSLRIQQRPLFIVKPSSIVEIETILNYVKEKNLTIRIMNGRHSSALVSSEVLVDMSGFTNKELKDDILIAGAGNTQGALNDFLFNINNREVYSHFGSFHHPRVKTNGFPGGSAQSVGAAGISTVGGVGTLSRTYGLTVDSVLEYTVTLPPTAKEAARTVVANAKTNPDLFWCLRGGGANNFSIVSSISYKIIEVTPVITYSIVWSWKEAEKILTEWQETSPERPDNFNEDIILYYNPLNKNLGIELSGIYVLSAGQSIKEANREIKKQLKSLGGFLTIKDPIPYSNLYKGLVENRNYFNFSIIQPMFIDNIDAKEVVKNLEIGKNRALKGPVSISFTLLCGKIKEVSSRATAFYPRKRQFFLDISSFWQSLSDTASMEAWTNKVISQQLENPRTIVYLGFPLSTGINYPNEIYYGKNYPRLKRSKEFYDPLNILTPTGSI